jgi:group I intron endonuclease
MIVNKIAGIYKIVNPNSKVYIGQSWDIANRKTYYEKVKCKSQTKIHNSLLKYGWETHTFEIIHELPQDATQEVIDNYEILYWQLYKDCEVEVLNIKDPGSRGRCSEETKRKMAESSKKENLSEATLERMSKAMKGRVISPSTREKMSKASTGKIYTKETLAKMSVARKGKPGHKHSDETKSKISAAHTGKETSKSHRENLSAAIKGRKYSLEQNYNRSKNVICVQTGEVFKSAKHASLVLGVSVESIRKILTGVNSKTKGGLSFRYILKQLPS